MTTTVDDLREAVRDRSGGRCEAVWGLWAGLGDRCPNRAVHVHHRLGRRRGGLILDAAGDIDNLAHLCGTCHDRVHVHGHGELGDAVGDYGDVTPLALRSGLYVGGEVTTGLDGRPVYEGPSAEYAARYPRRAHADR